ncbi:DUF7512 family protein [Halomarina halobia]
MLGSEPLAGFVQAATPVGLVLVESLVLYVGYGGLSRFAGPHVKEALVRE